MLRAKPEIVSAIKKIDPAFTVEAVFSSRESEAVDLADGRRVVLLSGCTMHACFGTGHWIAVDVKSKAVALLKEDEHDLFVLVGAENAELRRALLDFARRALARRIF